MLNRISRCSASMLMAIAVSSDSDVTFSLHWKAADINLNLEHSPYPQNGGLFLIMWSSSHFHPPWTTTSTELQPVAARRLRKRISFVLPANPTIHSILLPANAVRPSRTWPQSILPFSPQYRLRDNIKGEHIHPSVNCHKQEYVSWLLSLSILWQTRRADKSLAL
jgi:hypothetical protein